MEVVEVAGVACDVVDGFDAAVEHCLGVAAREGDGFGDEGVGHPRGIWFGGVGGLKDGGERRHGGESEEHFGDGENGTRGEGEKEREGEEQKGDSSTY